LPVDRIVGGIQDLQYIDAPRSCGVEPLLVVTTSIDPPCSGNLTKLSMMDHQAHSGNTIIDSHPEETTQE
jgi:hypothetical protein